MPLKALVNDQIIHSWQCSNEEWENLRDAQKRGDVKITFTCCDARVILREGSRIKHFAHYRRPDNCNWQRESLEHEAVKFKIARTCHEAGWDTDTEVSGPGYEADVLATKGDLKIAFEVQLSHQTLEKTLVRRKKFIDDGVRDYWLFKKFPSTCKSDKKTKRFNLLTKEQDDFYIQYDKSSKKLETFINQILENAVREPDTFEGESNEDVDFGDPFKEITKLLGGLLLTVLGIAALNALLTKKTQQRPVKRVQRRRYRR